ncbi:MAG TPA: hypothetical protein VHB77_17300 [Planctomycetaceae bacterium]|nr:hypothetical protein [Planctomycetaceae bacterium]
MLPVFAYFDPGAGSVVLQALVGGSAGLWVAVRYWWNLPKPTRNEPSLSEIKTQPSSNAEIERRTAI